MIRKKNLNLIFIILIAILILGILVIGSMLLRRLQQSKSVSNTAPDTSTPQTATQMQQSENENSTDINTVIISYIHNQYPTARNIQPTMEYVGLGYAIFNTAYTIDDEEITKKIYLEYHVDTWNFLYESDGNISCETAREISASNSILTLNCTE